MRVDLQDVIFELRNVASRSGLNNPSGLVADCVNALLERHEDIEQRELKARQANRRLAILNHNDLIQSAEYPTFPYPPDEVRSKPQAVPLTRSIQRRQTYTTPIPTDD